LLAAGCGTGGLAKGGDPAQGGPLFVQKCGSCHTLAAAQTKGTVGPNLDDAFSSARRQGYKQSTIQQVVRDQIEIAGGRMPANLVRGGNAVAVAAYVAACAAVQKPGASCKISAAVGPALPGLAGKGQNLYASLGCQGCHTTDGSKSTGPTFKGLFGRTTKLTNGQTVTANLAYLLTSIRDPDKQIVAGYQPGIMSSAIKPGSVSVADAKALIAFIKTLK
jgi:cytochrome c2